MTTPVSAMKGARRGTAAPSSRRWLALGLLSLAQLMLMLDVTVVNVALPAIGTHLHLDRPTLTWVLTSYTLAFGGLMLLGGRLADLLGARRVMLTGLAVFTGASLLSGLAGAGAVLLGGRAAQGIGAALLSPSALSLVTTTFTGAERTKALGIWAAIGGAGSAIGVLAGGVLTSAAGWRWIFFINVPVGVLVLTVLPALVVGGRTRTGRARVDVPGALAVTTATGAAIYGLISAGSHGWLTARTLIPLGTAVVLYAVFAVIEHTVAAPLMDLRMLARRPVSAGAFLMLVGTGLLVGAFFLGSFYLQQHQGYSALHTGLLFLPVVAAIVAGAQAASYAVGHLDARVLASSAFALAAVGGAVAARWLGTVTLVTGMSVAAAGIGVILVTATTTALARVGADEAGVGSGIVNTFHELGGAIGVAAVSSIAAPSLLATAVSPAGFTHAFTFNAIAALAAAVLAAAAVPPGKASAGTTPTKPTQLRVNTALLLQERPSMTTMTKLSGLTGDYVLDTARTRIGFVGRHTMATKVRGQFDTFEGSAHLDGDDPSKSSAELTMQARSIQTRNRQRDKQLRSKFLDMDNHPTITFTSTGAEQVGETTFKVTGDLTIRGVTKPVIVDFELTGAENDPRGDFRVGFRGSVTINRKDWGVNWNAATGVVSKKVMLEFDVAVIRQS